MRLKHVIFFVFFTLFFLFYPGDSYYFHLFAFNRQLFAQPEQKLSIHVLPVPYVKYPYYPDISAQGAYVLELNSFTPVFERDKNGRFFPASTTKMITALTAFDLFKPDDVIQVKHPLNVGQTMGLIPNERITVENLFYGMLVHSGNDAAYALADSFGYQKFVALMNQKAQSIGMTHSHFTNPAGLDDPNQYTSPFDLALAARELLKNKYLAKITSIKEITISDVDFKIFHQLSNVNQLLGEVQGIGGLKTGYTENALENLVSLYKYAGHEYIIVVLHSQDRFQDTKNIVKWIDSDIGYLTL